MSIFRRLSLIVGGNSEEEPRSPHRHHHPLHRTPKNYDISPTGGNRPISISADPRISFPPAAAHSERHRSSRHKSRSDTAGAPVRKSRSRSDTAEAPVTKHSARSRKHRSEIAPGPPAELESSEGSVTPPSEPVAVPAPAIDMSKRVPASPPSGSSMGIVISGRRKRRGTNESVPSTPIITQTPPTPSPLEQARRSNSHPSFTPSASFSGNAPPPYPETPPVSNHGEEYIAYAASKIAVGMPEQNSLLHRYRSTFDPLVGRAELSSEPAPVEIGSSDSIYQPPRPQRTDSGKSFNSQEAAPKQPSMFRRKRGSLRENQYDFLRTFDTVFVIDDSASMDAYTRWTDTRAALETIATIATKYDSDGIDIHFLNSSNHDARNIRSAAEVRRLFDQVRPAGITPIAACLDRILRDYLDAYAAARSTLSSPPTSPGSSVVRAQYPKPLNIIVLTDGEPTDDPESVIVDAARRLDALNAPLSQVGIQFFQIGDEEGAREALEDLDDALAEIYGIRDMVDYTPYIGNRQDKRRQGEEAGGDGEPLTGEWILKVLTGAVNRRLDRWENDHGSGRGV